MDERWTGQNVQTRQFRAGNSTAGWHGQRFSLFPWVPSQFSDAVLVILVRLALRPFTFSNGMTVPAGTVVAAPLNAIHTDGEIYPNPDEFDGFRFAKLRELGEDEMARSKHQAGTTSTTHMPFGHGRHAW